MKLAGLSAVAHVAGLVLFSVLPRFMTPPRPPTTTIATIVPASALFPGPPSPVPQAPRTGPTPSERAEEAKKALQKKPEPKKPAAKAKKPEPKPRVDETIPPLESPPEKKEEMPAALEEPAPAEAAPAGPETDETDEGGGIRFGAGGEGAPGGIPSIGSSAFPYDYYRASLVALLQSNWRRPAAPGGLGRTLGCRVRFTILKSGIIQEPRIVEPSGNPALDQSALRAVYDSNPLPPLPFQYGHTSVSAEVLFELTPD